MKTILAKILPWKFISGMYEALTKVAREYQDIGEAQERGGYESYATGLWIGGLKRGHKDRVKQMIRDAGGDPDSVTGPQWWDAVPPKRGAYFFAMVTESTSPMRAQLRAGEFLNKLLEDAELDGLIESVRVEIEPLWPEWKSSHSADA